MAELAAGGMDDQAYREWKRVEDAKELERQLRDIERKHLVRAVWFAALKMVTSAAVCLPLWQWHSYDGTAMHVCVCVNPSACHRPNIHRIHADLDLCQSAQCVLVLSLPTCTISIVTVTRVLLCPMQEGQLSFEQALIAQEHLKLDRHSQVTDLKAEVSPTLLMIYDLTAMGVHVLPCC